MEEYRARFSINVLENAHNEILLLKRSQATDFGPGMWGFSSGHIETGESPEECSLRELHEEIGNHIEVELINRYGPVRDSFYGGVYQIYLFHYRWIDGSIHLNHEHTEYTWTDRHRFRGYTVMDGIDEDLYYLGIWPVKYLNREKLPVNFFSTSC